ATSPHPAGDAKAPCTSTIVVAWSDLAAPALVEKAENKSIKAAATSAPTRSRLARRSAMTLWVRPFIPSPFDEGHTRGTAVWSSTQPTCPVVPLKSLKTPAFRPVRLSFRPELPGASVLGQPVRGLLSGYFSAAEATADL